MPLLPKSQSYIMTDINLKALTVKAQNLLVEKRFNKALSESRKILDIDPNNVNALMVRSVALQKQNRNAEALSSLDQIDKLVQNFLPMKLVKIQVLAQDNKLSYAIKVANEALEIEPQNSSIWHELSICYYRKGDKPAADNAFKNYLIFSAGHPLLRDSLKAFFEGDLNQSEKMVRQFLKANPNNVSAIRLLAEIAIKLGILGDAQTLLERALSLAPDYHLARLNYAHTLNKREKSVKALAQIEALEKAQPDHLPVQIVKAAVLIKVGEYQSASDLYKQILDKHPHQPELWCSKGHADKTLGEQKRAIDCYKMAIELRPQYGEPYWSLANLKTYEFSTTQIERMETLLGQHAQLSAEDRAHLSFALGKAYENNGKYAESFTFYNQGNQVKRKMEPYNARGIEELVERNIKFFNGFNRVASKEAQPQPIFIVGLPRSGSTLLEQILSSHSKVDGTRELPDIMAIARTLGNRVKKKDVDKYPNSLQAFSAVDLNKLGEQYLQGTSIHRGSAPFFLDKMPNNFIHIGLIKSILPNAKIIDARRESTATCFSCFKQLFAVGQAYTNDLKDLRHYYAHYLKLMRFWKTLYPDDILTVQYEAVIANTQQQVSSILDFLNLPFEIACVNFHDNKRAVATASSEQVRQPINRKGLDAWRPYAAYIQDIIGMDLSTE